MKIEIIKNITDKKKIFMLLATPLMYILGGGIAHYLGANYHPINFMLGLFWIISIHLTGYLLILIFSSPYMNEKKNSINDIFFQKKSSILQTSILFFSVTGVFIAILLANNKITMEIGILLFLTMMGLVLLAIPPFNLSSKGYLEIGLAIFQGCLAPAFGYFILNNNIHRMLFLIMFPLTLLAIAFYIAMNFSTFASDKKIGRNSFVQKITWQHAAPVHHLMLLSPYLFFFWGVGRGLPVEIFRVALLTLPLAGFQIFWLRRITQGGKPLWPFFIILSASVYGLASYFIALTLWTL